ncbi:MAG: hypothetical protein WCK90_00530 [archaeon]
MVADAMEDHGGKGDSKVVCGIATQIRLPQLLQALDTLKVIASGSSEKLPPGMKTAKGADLVQVYQRLAGYAAQAVTDFVTQEPLTPAEPPVKRKGSKLRDQLLVAIVGELVASRIPSASDMPGHAELQTEIQGLVVCAMRALEAIEIR